MKQLNLSLYSNCSFKSVISWSFNF